MTNDETTNDEKPYLSNASYDALKKLVTLWLPGASSLYFVLGQIVDLSSVEQVVGITAILAAFFGIVLSVSSKRYSGSDSAYDGKMVVTENIDGRKIFSLELSDSPEALEDKDSVAFRVVTTLQ